MARPGPNWPHVGSLGRGKCRGAGAHGVPKNHRRLLELLDQGYDVARGLDITVGGKRRVAGAVSAEVCARDSVASLPKSRSEESIPGSQVAHTWHKNHHGSFAADVVANSPAGAREVDRARVSEH